MKLKLKYILGVCIGLCISFSSFSQSGDTIKSNSIHEVIIHGRNKTHKERAEFKRHAQTTEVLTEEELNRNNPAFVEQGLSTVAGVQVDKRTQLGGQRIVIRGYGNDQKFNNWGIKAYYNGVPITNAEGVTVMDDIDFGVVNNIEVIKGPASTLYGCGLGGVVRFYLKNDERPGITVSQKLIGGSFGLLQSQSGVHFSNGNSNVSVNYGYLKSDGYRPHGSSKKNYLNVFGDFKISDKQSVNVYASHNHSLERISGQISYADYYAGIDPGNLAYIKKDGRNDFTTDRFSITNIYRFTEGFSNRTSFFYSHSDYINVSAGAQGNSSNPNYGIRSEFNYKTELSDNLSNDLHFGLELQQSKSLASSFRFTGTNDTIPLQVKDISAASYLRTTNNQSLYFVQDRLTYNLWELSFIAGFSTGKVSYTRLDLLATPGLLANYNKDVSFKNSFGSGINPHLALQKSIRGQIINLSYSAGYNAPTATTSFISGVNSTNDSLLPERGKMIDLSVQGLLLDTKLDYQVSFFSMDIRNKLTQLSGKDPLSGTAYTYWANTGHQRNQGMEFSLGYAWIPVKKSFLVKLEPFASVSYYQFKYVDFSTKTGSDIVNYAGKKVVGVPDVKCTFGLDMKFRGGVYWYNTLNYLGSVYTDFANTNLVKGFHLLNSKVGYKKSFSREKLELDVFVAGNNLTGQVNYTFLFLGNAINDSDPGNGYPANVTTDVNPGASKAYFFGGIGLKYLIH